MPGEGSQSVAVRRRDGITELGTCGLKNASVYIFDHGAI